MVNKNECQQCGVCCTKGGPALHLEDLHLVLDGKIPINRLITIRKGEMVLNPLKSEPVSAKCEILKVAGTGKEWQCFYLNNEKNGCDIYENRPIACSTLKCWDTVEIEKIIEHNMLTRFDIISKDNPLFGVMVDYEKQITCPDMSELAGQIKTRSLNSIDTLESEINNDIAFRTKVIGEYGITLAEELFYFGRPLFSLLQKLGLRIQESSSRLTVSLG